MANVDVHDDRLKSPRELRETWIFRYRITDVRAAARKKGAVSQKEAKKAELAVKEKGLEYRPRMTTSGNDFEIVGDPNAISRFRECKHKVRQHTRDFETYEMWDRALASHARRNPKAELELKISDILFFGL
jgi:Zn-finger domain-containing protein